MDAIHPAEHSAWKSTYEISPTLRLQLGETRANCNRAIDYNIERIIDLEQQIAALQAQNQKLSDRIVRLDSGLSPFKDLPLEIFSLILEFANGDAPFYVPDNNRNWRPDLVCMLWRSVTVNTGALHRCVNVDYKTGARCDASQWKVWEAFTCFLQSILQRGTHCLSICLRDLATDRCAFAVSKLMNRRLDTVRISHWSPSPAILETVQMQMMQMPALRDLDLDYADPDDINFTHYHTKARPINEALSLHISHAKVPWCNLTRLNLAGDEGKYGISLSAQMVHDILDNCRRIQTLKLRFNGVASENPTLPTTSLRHEMLENLAIFVTYDATSWPDRDRLNDPLGALLSPLTLPRLKSLGLDHPRFYGVFTLPMGSIPQLLDRSRCTLHKFYGFLDVILIDPETDELLQQLSTVEELYFGPRSLPGQGLRQIASGELLPHLSHLGLSLLPHDLKSFEASMHVARARKNRQGATVAPLLTATFYVYPLRKFEQKIDNELVAWYEQEPGGHLRYVETVEPWYEIHNKLWRSWPYIPVDLV